LQAILYLSPPDKASMWCREKNKREGSSCDGGKGTEGERKRGGRESHEGLGMSLARRLSVPNEEYGGVKNPGRRERGSRGGHGTTRRGESGRSATIIP